MREEKIDFQSLAAAIPERFDRRVEEQTRALRGLTSHHFHRDPVHAYGRRKGLRTDSCTFQLFPPNVAVLDFSAKYLSNDDLILDYGCGMGTLLVYLQQLGFSQVFGYDNWAQITRPEAEAFLKTWGQEQRLLNADEIVLHDITVLVCCGILFDWVDPNLLSHNSLKYVLFDRAYRPKKIDGFECMAEYRDLLTVFRRQQ